jgi:hypothetical protein
MVGDDETGARAEGAEEGIKGISIGIVFAPLVVCRKGGRFVRPTSDTDSHLHFYSCAHQRLRLWIGRGGNTVGGGDGTARRVNGFWLGGQAPTLEEAIPGDMGSAGRSGRGVRKWQCKWRCKWQ